MPRIAIAICTWNRAPLLRQTLERMTQLRVPEGSTLTILVVNNNSTDETPAVIDEFRSRLPLQDLFVSQPGISYARNAALEALDADYILFTDDDVLVDEDWAVNFMAAAERHPTAVAFGGRIDPWFPSPADPILVQAFPALARGFCGLDRGPAERVLSDEEDVTGANMAFRKALVGAVRFRTDLGVTGTNTLGGDELDFQTQLRRNGGQVVWVPTMRIQHYVAPARMALPYLLKFSEDGGRREIRLHGVPPGPQLFGVPRWLLRRALDFHLAALWHRIKGERAESLRCVGKRYEFMGRAKESWARRRDRPGPTTTPRTDRSSADTSAP